MPRHYGDTICPMMSRPDMHPDQREKGAEFIINCKGPQCALWVDLTLPRVDHPKRATGRCGLSEATQTLDATPR